MKKTILIVEDEQKLRDTVADFLKLYEYDIIEAKDGGQALDIFNKNMRGISLILLDVMLPVHDGQYVLKKIREVSSVPVIMITAKTGDYEQLKSFGNGADDYIKKPFTLGVLKARIEALLKRTNTKIEKRADILKAGKLEMNCISRKAYADGEYFVTTPKEFDLLCYMIENEKVALRREQILDAVWGSDYDGTFRTVDTVIKQIRIKIAKKCPYIKSIYGVGYIFEVEDV